MEENWRETVFPKNLGEIAQWESCLKKEKFCGLGIALSFAKSYFLSWSNSLPEGAAEIAVVADPALNSFSVIPNFVHNPDD